jgi:hypothetical protein
MAQVVSHWLLALEAQVCTWDNPCVMCCGQSVTDMSFSKFLGFLL